MRESEPLVDQFADDFTGPRLNEGIWQTVHRTAPTAEESARAENGCLVMQATKDPSGGTIVTYTGVSTRHRHFHPGLTGTNVFEMTLLDYQGEGESEDGHITVDGFASEHEDPISGHYIMGFCIAIGSVPELVGVTNGPDGRVVQIHCDWFSRMRLWFILNRNIVAGDEDRYPFFTREREGRMLREGEAPQHVFMTEPGNSVTLAIRRPFADNAAWGHRWGLGLTDDADTLFWTLDSQVMDTFDITGFFRSSPGCVADGAFLTLTGGGTRCTNTWKVADVRGKVSVDS